MIGRSFEISEAIPTEDEKADPPAAFDWFVGVDWSGARGPRLPGLQVAMAKAGRSAPRLVPSPDGQHWTRSAFADWFVEILSPNGRVLVGFDFAFSFPRFDRGEFFPNVPDAPSTVADLWLCVDDVCEATGDFFAGAFVEGSRYARYFQGGVRYEPRLRITDERCRRVGLGRPESIFRLVGPAQVAKGSLAGMRVLHYLRFKVPHLCIWPFDRLPESRSVIVAVDMYPGAFVRISSAARGKVRDMQTLNQVLEFYGSAPLRGRILDDGSEDDKADALIAAAALRRLSGDGTVWNPPGLSVARWWQEGWIFGVT